MNQCRQQNMYMAARNQQPRKDVTMENNLNSCLENFPLAMAYVPYQQWRNICSTDMALNHGTIFEELMLPFCGRGVSQNG